MPRETDYPTIADDAIELLSEICENNIAVPVRTIGKILNNIKDPNDTITYFIQDVPHYERKDRENKLVRPEYYHENYIKMGFGYKAYRKEIFEEFKILEEEDAINNYISIEICLDPVTMVYFYIVVKTLDSNITEPSLNDEVTISIITKDVNVELDDLNEDTYEYLIAMRGE